MRNRGHNKKLLSRLATISYLFMVAANIAANLIPLNGVNTGQVSDSYDNLFTPTGFTFLIWFVIYILLGVYVIYQTQFNNRRPDNNDRVVRRVNLYFVTSNIVNILWVVCWHYDLILLTLILMIILFVLLLMIRETTTNRTTMTKKERQSIVLPFSVYYGWVLVAFIGNISTYITSINWLPGSLSGEGTSLMFIVIGGVLVILNVLRYEDVVIGFVGIWSFVGILYKHIVSLNGEHNSIVVGTLLILVLILSSIIWTVLMMNNKKRRKRS